MISHLETKIRLVRFLHASLAHVDAYFAYPQNERENSKCPQFVNAFKNLKRKNAQGSTQISSARAQKRWVCAIFFLYSKGFGVRLASPGTFSYWTTSHLLMCNSNFRTLKEFFCHKPSLDSIISQGRSSTGCPNKF